MAKVGRCQSVIFKDRVYYYGETIPYVKWKVNGKSESEMWDARIVSVGGMRENRVEFVGVDRNGNPADATVNMDDVVEG